MVNAALVILAGCAALVTAQNVQNVPQQFQGLGLPLGNAPKQGLDALGQLSSRLGDAFVSTYDNARENVYDALDTIRETGQKGVESGVKLFKNGVGLLFFLPRLGRNFLSNQQPPARVNQYPPGQFNPQVTQNNPQAAQYNYPQAQQQYRY